MSEALHHTEKKSWLSILAKITFFAAAFFLVIFTVLANMGGNTDTLKHSAEQFALEVTGLKTEIKTLNNMNFFPTVRLDIEDADLFREPIDDVATIHVDRLQTALSFWDVALRNGKMKAMNIVGLTARPGAIFGKALDLTSLAIYDVSETEAKMEAKGTIGPHPISFMMGMEVSGSGRDKKYWFGARRIFTMTLGDTRVETTLQNANNPYLVAQDLKISLKGNDVISGRLEIGRRRTRELTIGGEFIIAGQKTILKPDLVYDIETGKISGKIAGMDFKRQDFAAGSQFDQLIKNLISVLGDEEKDQKLLDSFVSHQDIILDTQGEITSHAPLAFENNILKIQ